MRVVVTDLTRMGGGHICVAGVDLKTGGRVRPVLHGQLTQSLLRRNRGPFDLRAMVDIGPCRSAGKAPEVEDVEFEPGNCIDLGDMEPNEFYTLCRSSSSPGLSAFGPELIPAGRTRATQEGQGERSLVMVTSTRRPRVYIDDYQRVRFAYYDDGAFLPLPVTEIRLCANDLMQPDPRKVEQLTEWLGQCDEIVISLGLTRPWQKPQDNAPRHWLQVNNIHLKTNPGWQLG